MDLAVEKNETQCRALRGVVSWFSGEPYRTWRTNGFARALIQTGKKRGMRGWRKSQLSEELMDEFKTDDVGRRLATVVLASGEFGLPYQLPPGIPAERLKILREAFMKTDG